MKIFSVEDNQEIQDLLQFSLSNFGYDVSIFDTAEKMFEAFDGGSLPDLILLDIMLPGMSGTDALQKLKTSTLTESIPVIMLTAKSSEINIVSGLELGADDYITKPFSVMELAARVKANLRKYAKVSVDDNIVINTTSHEVFIDGEKTHLTLTEFQLLNVLMSNKNNVLKREDLLNDIWGYDYYGETRTLDMHIKAIRAKLGKYAGRIETVRGVGFKYTTD